MFDQPAVLSLMDVKPTGIDPMFQAGLGGLQRASADFQLAAKDVQRAFGVGAEQDGPEQDLPGAMVNMRLATYGALSSAAVIRVADEIASLELQIARDERPGE